jgi:hypothetical protein
MDGRAATNCIVCNVLFVMYCWGKGKNRLVKKSEKEEEERI